MIKVTKKMYKDFLNIMDEYNEFVFGSDKEVRKQLEVCLNTQGYWSATAIRIYYNQDTKAFSIANRF